ncbi:MAG: cobalamin-binding protein [Dehalococcoidia bacterium]|nr:cobalamin-binding protein [Dehalococcoidia bacterium]
MRLLQTSRSLLALALLVLAAACAQPTPTPTPTLPPSISVTDSEGTIVLLQAPPRRIVSLGPSNTEVLYALGVSDRVVGVDDYSDYPQEAQSKPKVGSPFPSFNLEVILALQPDLVVSVPLAQFNDQLRSAGLKVIVLDPHDLDEVLFTILLAGRAVGVDWASWALVTAMQGRIEAVEQRVKDAAKARVFYEVDATDPAKPYTAGPGSFVHSLVTLAGGKNIFEDAQAAFPQVSLEVVVARDPEVILLGDALVPYNPQTPEIVAARPGWEIITAVKKGTVIPVNGDLTTRPGPRIVDGLELIAKTLHPELFP